MEIKWHGWADFEVTTNKGIRILVDAYFNGPHKPEDVKKLDHMVITHGSFDHALNWVNIAKRTNPKMIFCDHGTKIHGLRNGLANEKFRIMVPGFSYTFDGIQFRCVQSVHVAIFISKNGDPEPGAVGEKEGEPLTSFPFGIIITDEDNTSVYIPGDSAIGPHLRMIGELYRPNIALLHCVGCPGWSAEMTPKEAAIALQWLGAQVAIPMHYDPNNASMDEEVNEFIKYCVVLAPNTKVVKLKPGEIFRFTSQRE
jgi:L-ascorbate metabolism protein UlaG (beta-lactamase superfamily)